MAPRIDRNAIYDIKIHAGQNFDFDVPIIGEPPASKEWTCKGNFLVNTDRVKITNEDYSTKIRVVDARRSDSGPYGLTAKNINGVDQVTVNIVVLGNNKSIMTPYTTIYLVSFNLNCQYCLQMLLSFVNEKYF